MIGSTVALDEIRSARRIGFVPPRYGEGVVGGAEAVLHELAHDFAARGWDVEVLTTCARDHYTWANSFPAGASRDGAITVRRFRTVVSRDPKRAWLEEEILKGGELTLTEQQRWMNGSFRVPDLFHWLLDHAAEYGALVFAPYPFWTTFACSLVAPERTVLMPCLHDEPYAYLDLFQPVFSGAGQIWFQTDPEHELAHSIFKLPRSHDVVGSPVRAPQAYDPDGFRARHGIEGRFILYAGRREGGKGWERLLHAFAWALHHKALPFSLVTMGVGDVRPPGEIADRVIDLGLVSEADRNDAFAAADAYIQPSEYESFSRTIMEAWLAGTFVIGNGASKVVTWHCERSGAGLTYDDDYELAECLAFVAQQGDAATALAAAGRAYVLDNYSPDIVVPRMEATIATRLQQEARV